MMRCTCCGNDEAVSYEREIDGQKTEVRLCPACYKKLYKDLGEGEFFAAFSELGDEKKACPTCGTTLADFRATGLVGCAFCYTFFRAELLPVVRSAQGRIVHTGSAPSSGAEEKYDETIRLVQEKKRLEDQLALAKARGDEAAVRTLGASIRAVNRALCGGEGAE